MQKNLHSLKLQDLKLSPMLTAGSCNNNNHKDDKDNDNYLLCTVNCGFLSLFTEQVYR